MPWRRSTTILQAQTKKESCFAYYLSECRACERSDTGPNRSEYIEFSSFSKVVTDYTSLRLINYGDKENGQKENDNHWAMLVRGQSAYVVGLYLG